MVETRRLFVLRGRNDSGYLDDSGAEGNSWVRETVHGGHRWGYGGHNPSTRERIPRNMSVIGARNTR